MTKKCVVKINDERFPADFYGVYQRAWTHGESPLMGGFKAGQIAYPVAVVDFGNGIREVDIEVVEEVME